ncbi:MAG: hypothetical protein U9R77_02150 [Pseudomonadota bacterium]|uniref:hypothetical protein n=1 Tax=Sphingobium naphthae TaxID=1886786 RepID=UPI002B11B2FA|nr:hypothetical protein [Pseudomonadota bacterium]
MTFVNMAMGILLGLLLAFAVAGTGALRWGVTALCVLSGFQLRLADRRWDRRGGALDWISHVRMAPARLLPWGAAVIIAIIARSPQDAQALAFAALLCELMVYPASAVLLGRMTRGAAVILLIALIAVQGITTHEGLRYSLAFLTGVATCITWLRGPDGDGRTSGIALVGCALSIFTPVMVPPLLILAVPAASACAMLALATMSTLRRRPVPWRTEGGDGPRLRRGWPPLPSRPA